MLSGGREKSSTLRKKLEEYEEEHTRMQNLEKDREAEYNLAAAKLEGLRNEGDPKRQCGLILPHWRGARLLASKPGRCSLMGARPWIQAPHAVQTGLTYGGPARAERRQAHAL